MPDDKFEVCLDCHWPFNPGTLDDDWRCPRCADIAVIFGEEEILEEDCS